MALGNGNIARRLSDSCNLPVSGLHDKNCAGLPQPRFMKDKVPETAKMKTMLPSCQLQAVPMPADLASSSFHMVVQMHREVFRYSDYIEEILLMYSFIFLYVACFPFKNNDASPATRVYAYGHCARFSRVLHHKPKQSLIAFGEKTTTNFVSLAPDSSQLD